MPDQHTFPKLAAPAMRALTNAGYTHLDQLTEVTEAELAKLHGMGPNALTKLREALAEKGLAFKNYCYAVADIDAST